MEIFFILIWFLCKKHPILGEREVIYMRKMNKKGFTLVEIMIVVAIIGLLAAIAIPNFVKARQSATKNACIANMKQIQGAIQVWAIDNSKAGDAAVVQNTAGATVGVVPDYIKKWPSCGTTAYVCPATVDATPVCAANPTGHVLST